MIAFSERHARWASLLVLLILWQLVATIANNDALPAPLAVLDSLWAYTLDGSLPFHLGMTLMRVSISFTVAMLLGVMIGIAMGRYHRIDMWLDGLLVVMLNIPALVVIILCFIWLGLNETAGIVAVIINKLPTVVVTIREGARDIDGKLLQVGEAFNIGKKRMLLKIYLPQLYPYILAAARSGIALIWKIVLVVELLGHSNGVGFQLSTFFQYFDITSILAYSIAFAMLVMAIEAMILRPIDARVSRGRV